MKKVYVGLSGGVDSATSAGLLKAQGYDVTGVFIKIWSPEFLECTWESDRLDAMRSAVALGIPFKEIDLSQEYRRTVIDDMIREYERGVTPNPDVLCNRSIKFGAFKDWALKDGADLIATGHYARVRENSGSYSLMRGADPAKDQSYFLHRLRQDDLAHSLFPAGGIAKTQIRAHARRLGLSVAAKPDSQGLCFVGDVSMEEFLSRFINVSRGELLATDGALLGEHAGAALYTKGQRHGFTLAPEHSAKGPFFVVSRDMVRNTVTVSSQKDDALSESAHVIHINWIRAEPKPETRLVAQVRYRAKPTAVTLTKEGDGYEAEFDEPQIASPGQAIVFYTDDECLGGGVLA